MEFPFGHHTHHHRRQEEEPLPPPSPYPPPAHHHHRRQEEEPPPPPYPPPAHHHHHRRQEEEPLPPPSPYPPPAHHHHHDEGGPYPPQPTAYYSPPPHISHEVNPYPHPQPPHAHVQHIYHEQNHKIHIPSFIHHHTHITERDSSSSEFSSKPTVAVFCKAETGYSLTIRDHRVILARSNPNDIFQHWIKDEKYSTRVKDEQGFPSFALINKATGQAIKHSIGHAHPVQLISHDADKFDESILWTESNDLGDGYRTIRMLNNIRLNLDAFNGDKNHGGVHDGTTVVLWEWKKGDNQRWKIAPYCMCYSISVKNFI